MKQTLARALRWLARNGDFLRRMADRLDPPASTKGGGGPPPVPPV